MARCLAPAAPIAGLAVDDLHAICVDKDLLYTGLPVHQSLVIPDHQRGSQHRDP